MPSVTSFDDPNPPFYPPPEWLSDSPARPPPSHGSTPKPSPNRSNASQRDNGWRQTPTAPTARRSSRSASATGPATPAVTHLSYPNARLGLFPQASTGDSPQHHNRYSTRTRNTDYSTPTDHHHYQSGQENPIDRNQLLSPAPPPPANLHTPQAAAAFSVDPGVPFLATAGPTEDGSDNGEGHNEGYDDKHGYGSNVPASMRPGPGPRNLVGGLVTGIRNVVRKSTRRRTGDNAGMGRSEGEYDQYEPDHDYGHDYDLDYGRDLPQRQDEPALVQRTRTRDSGYAPSTPQYDDAPAPTPAQPTPASLYAQQIQLQEHRVQQDQREQQDRRRGPAPVSPIARDYVRGEHPSPHRLPQHQDQHPHPHSQGHTPAETHVRSRPRIVVDPDINEYHDDDEAVPFTYTPPGVPPPHIRGYRLHDAPVPSPHPSRRHSRPAPLPLDPPSAGVKPRLNLLSPDNADNTQTPPLPSPVSATPHYAPDYAQMNLPASALAAMGLRGDKSLKVYARKVKKGWEAWKKMPWVAGLDDDSSESDEGDGKGTGADGRRRINAEREREREREREQEVDLEEEEAWRKRVTWDYYPQRQRRRIGRMAVRGGRGGVWKDNGKGSKGSSHNGNADDDDDYEVPKGAHVPAIEWRSAHYRVSLDEAAMLPFRRDAAGDRFQGTDEGPWAEDEWHEGAWDSDGHGDPEAGSHYRSGGGLQGGHESDPDGWTDIRPLNQDHNHNRPRRNVVITPQRRSYADVNLGDEFEAVTPAPVGVGTPLPLHPPPPPPPGGSGPLPMYPPGQTPAVPSGPMPYYPPAPGGISGGQAGALGNSPQPSRTRSVNAATPTSAHQPPPIEPIEDDHEPPSAPWDRSRGFPPPLLPHPRPPGHQQDTSGPPSRQASASSPIWSRPPPGQPPGTYAPMPAGFEDGASRRRSQSGHASHSPTHSHHSRAPSHRSYISAASRPPPGQPPGTYVPFHEHEGPGGVQRQGSSAYAPSARSRASSQRSRPPPGQPLGTYPPFNVDEHENGGGHGHGHAHRREPAYGNGSAYAPSRASSNRSYLPPAPPPPGQPPGTYPPAAPAQAHLAYTPSHASRRSHASRISRTSHASSNPFRPPPGQPPGTYPPFRDEFAAARGDYGGGGVEEEEEGSYDNYTPTPAPRGVAGTAPSGGAPSSRSHISTRSHRLLQTPGPASARSLAARELAGASDEEDDEEDYEDYHDGGSGTREVYPQGYASYEDQRPQHQHQEEDEAVDWHDPRGPGGPGYGEDFHLTFGEALALRERRQRPQ